MPSCKKESQPNEIPVVQVNIAIDPNSTQYLELNVVNGWVTITGGYRGIIVYRKSLNEFMAYERACPYDWDQTDTRLMVDSSGITVYCPSCHSRFILLDGTPFDGPSPYPMKQYQTTYDGHLLYIYN
jgi:nitrite reductase/ring-hydroxylating ferredoxin subunit